MVFYETPVDGYFLNSNNPKMMGTLLKLNVFNISDNNNKQHD